MKNINLYFDMEFTSLSPDAQIISLGIVSDDMINVKYKEFKDGRKAEIISTENGTKSFYAEFTDFDINRCDDWVRENVVGKLKHYGTKKQGRMFVDSSIDEGSYWGSQNTVEIKEALYRWLKQFSDCQIQFVCDCGTFDWYHLLQLIGEWDEVRTNETYVRESDGILCDRYRMLGLPKLPSNISPVPQDLNDLIAFKNGVSVREAFNLNREEFLISDVVGMTVNKKSTLYGDAMNKHNSLWDAKVIKAIFEKIT